MKGWLGPIVPRTSEEIPQIESNETDKDRISVLQGCQSPSFPEGKSQSVNTAVGSFIISTGQREAERGMSNLKE